MVGIARLLGLLALVACFIAVLGVLTWTPSVALEGVIGAGLFGYSAWWLSRYGADDEEA